MKVFSYLVLFLWLPTAVSLMYELIRFDSNLDENQWNYRRFSICSFVVYCWALTQLHFSCVFHILCLVNCNCKFFNRLTFAPVRLDPFGTTGRLDSHWPAVDVHCSSASQVCRSITSLLLLLVQSTLVLSPTTKCFQFLFTSSYKTSYINQSWIFSYMKINTKVKLEHTGTQSQIYICCPPRTPSKLLRVQRLLRVEKALKKKVFRTLLTMTLNITYHAIWHWTIKQLTFSMYAKYWKLKSGKKKLK